VFNIITPANKDLPVIIKGTVYDPVLTITVNGVAKDLAACTATLNITKSATDTDSLLALTETSGLTLGTDGTIEIEMQETTTSSLPVGMAHYALDVVESGDTFRYMEGNIPIRS